MAWTTHDLSEITDALVALLTTAVHDSPIWTTEGGAVPYFLINVSANSPDTLRTGQHPGECQLSLYLLHVGQDPYFRNTPVAPGAMANDQHPLGLNLTYLLTAYAPDNALREQQAMSIALSYFHEHPTYRGPADPITGQFPCFTVSLGADALSEMSSLWQSFSAAYRLSTLYRVAIAFMTPSRPPKTLSPPPSQIGLAVAPSAAPARAPQIFGALRRLALEAVAGGATEDDVRFSASPILMQGGVNLRLGGTGLNPETPLPLILSRIDGGESWAIDGWRSGAQDDSVLSLTPPAVYAIGAAPAPPASTPAPGVYLLSLGDGGPSTPILIAPVFADVATPPLLAAVGGVYSFSGAGFSPDATRIFVEGEQIDAGAVTIDAEGTQVSFTLPAEAPHKTLSLRVRVDGVDAPVPWRVLA